MASHPDALKAPAKIIAIFSDGTGNTYTGTPSNVRRLYELSVQAAPTQVAYYAPGVGTCPREPGENYFRHSVRHMKELWLGTGVIENLIELYSYVVQHYESGDRVFLFGFSRGAFTVRALAGMLHVCGLLQRESVHLVARAANLYQTSESRIILERRKRDMPEKFGRKENTDHASFDQEAGDFKAKFSRPCTVDFLGIWDTVKAYGWLWPKSFPALRHNSSVETIRHAVSLDEQRALFKMTGWADRNPRIKEVWFAGDHSDVGGGQSLGNSPLSDASLRWMLGEATEAGLLLNPDKRAEVRRIEHDSHQATSTKPNNLWWRRGFFILDSVPRVELDNAVYPPRRRGRVFCLDGTRKPGDHIEAATTLLVHQSVDTRSKRGDPHYAPPRLVKRSRHRRGSVQKEEVRLQAEPDRPIHWRS